MPTKRSGGSATWGSKCEHRLRQQLVRENAQTIDRRGFNAKDDRPQGYRPAAVTARKGKCGWSEIALGTDEHQNARGAITMFGRIFREDFLEMNGVGLKRAGQLQIEMPPVREELRHRLWRLNPRQPVLTALFRRFDRDRLPLRLFGCGAFFVETNHGPIRNDRRDFGSADLDSFLRDEVHVFPFRDRLSKGDLAAERRRLRFVQFAETDVR